MLYVLSIIKAIKGKLLLTNTNSKKSIRVWLIILFENTQTSRLDSFRKICTWVGYMFYAIQETIFYEVKRWYYVIIPIIDRQII